jgi:glycosyltransferase involved in cell wall biosynthesis
METWNWQQQDLQDVLLPNKFVIIMSCYNAEHTIKNAILSVLDQTHQDLGLIIRNDQSTDNTDAVVRELFSIADAGEDFYLINDKRDVIYISNKRKLYYGGNSYESVIEYISDPYTIVGLVDGDDFLADPKAVELMEAVYRKDPNKWLVWSQHISRAQLKKNYIGYSKPLPADDVIYKDRKYWAISHFRTSLAGLYHLIDPKGFIDPLNPDEYAKVCGDAGFLYPMAEMCGNQRCHFLDERLYYYNDGISSNDSQVYKDEIELYRAYFEDMPMYRQLPENFKF